MTGAAPRWPMPPRLGSVSELSRYGFVGRDGELAVLAKAMVDADGGEQQVVVLSGEPGIGKTTLLREAAEAALGLGAIVLYGGCDEDNRLPYQPFAEAIDHLVVNAPAAVLDARVASHTGELARLVPSLATRLPPAAPAGAADPDTERYLLYASVTRLVDRACEDALVVLVLDDLQWADTPSLALLRHLLASRPDRRLLALCAIRSSDVGHGLTPPEVVGELDHVGRLSRLKLGGLTTDPLAAMVSAAAEHPTGDPVAFANALRERTNGNPFFTIEILRDLAERGDLAAALRAPGPRTPLDTEERLPLSMREVITHRVQRLGDDAVAALAQAAVIGREFDFAVLQAITGLGDDPLLVLLERAIAAGVLQEIAGATDRFGFAHALIHQCLYAEMGTARRLRAHRRVGEALEALHGVDPGPRIAELAHHFAAAGATVEPGKAIDYARRAGDAALAALAPGEAERWYGDALRLHDERPERDGAQRGELLLLRGEAERQAGNPDYRETLLAAAEHARARRDTSLLVRAALANNRGRFGRIGAVDAERVAALTDALAATTGDSPDRARLLATLAIELTFSPDWSHRHDVAEQARAMARRLGDPRITVAVHNRTYDAVAPSTALEARRVEAADAVALARGLADPVDQFFACYYAIRASIESGALVDADGYLAECTAIADGLGQPYLLWWTAFLRSWRALLAGAVGEAEAHAEASLDIGIHSGEPEATLMYAALLAEIRRYEGRLEEVTELVVPAFEDFAGSVPLVRALLAQTFCETGDLDRARDLLQVDGRDGFAGVPFDYQWVETTTGYAEVCAAIGDLDCAAVLYRLLAPWHACIPFTGGAQTRGAVALYLGQLASVLDRHDDADSHLRDAVELHQRVDAPYWTARSRLEWARVLLRRDAAGDLDRARALLVTAEEQASRRGCAGIAAAAADTRRTLSERPNG